MSALLKPEDEQAVGEWWEPIETAPADIRVLLAFPAVDRPRKPLEPRQKGKGDKDWIKKKPSVTIGRRLNGYWVPGRTAAFFDEPTHWMHMPDLPDEYVSQASSSR